jgi:hypothetical protein
VLIGCAVVFTLALGFNQIFIDKVDAGSLRCNWTMSCIDLVGASCSDTLACHCRGDAIFANCYVGHAFGRGEGPSEMRIIKRINVDKKSIFLYEAGKCAWFSHEGTFERELKFAVKGAFRVSSVGGNNFLCLSNSKSVGKRFTPFDLSLYNYSDKEGIQFKKLVYYYEVPNLSKFGSKYDYRVLENTVKYCIYDEKIFIADSYRGFLVEAFDNQREKITQFKIPSKKKEVTEEYIKRRIALLKTSPQWEQAQIMYNFVFPEFFPAFSHFNVDEGKLYFLTFNLKNDDREVIITDLKGNLQKRAFVPLVENRMQKKFQPQMGNSTT